MYEFNPVIGGGECSNDRQETIVNAMVKNTDIYSFNATIVFGIILDATLCAS